MYIFEKVQYLMDHFNGRGVLWEKIMGGELLSREQLTSYIHQEIVGKNPDGDFVTTQRWVPKSFSELEDETTALQIVGVISHTAKNLNREGDVEGSKQMWESLSLLERIRFNRGRVCGLDKWTIHKTGTEVAEKVLEYLGGGIKESEKVNLRYAIMVNYCGKC